MNETVVFLDEPGTEALLGLQTHADSTETLEPLFGTSSAKGDTIALIGCCNIPK